MLIQLSAGASLIAATVAIQALFMSAGLYTLRSVEKHRPMMMLRRPTIATVIWVLFLMIPIILGVTLWAIFYYAQNALPSWNHSIFRPLRSRRSDMVTSFLAANGVSWQPSRR